MSTSLKRRTAEQFYHAGRSLFEENRYEEALMELRRAEEAFRGLDAAGQPFSHALSNGVSGLANTLALSGRCLQRLGQFDQAITCYETSFVNAKFEKAKRFQAFLATLQEDLSACYEQELSSLGKQTIQNILDQDAAIDISYLFPFSLDKNAICIARLYELAPARFLQFEGFYHRSKKADLEIRRLAGKERDESRMRKATASIWLILGALWAAYSMIVVKALLPK